MGLSAQALGYTYAHGTRFAAEALAGVNLAVEPGELTLVVGATGSGKSTLLRLLAGLLQPTAGAVTVDGLAPGSAEARGRVAIVFQNPEAQFFAESVLDDVAFGPRNLGVRDPLTVAADALAAVGLDPARFGPRSPFTLSGGEARRVAIAGALAMGARYLLLDEPTAGLDARGRRDVRAVLERERARSGVVVVTHDPDEFVPIATSVLVLESGQPAFWGSVETLLTVPGAGGAIASAVPEIVRVQQLAIERGMPPSPISFDPDEVASRLVASAEAAR